jgi:hypothetical protein
MAFDAIVEQAAEHLPVSAMVRALLENCLNDEFVDGIFAEHRRLQSQRKLVFSTIVSLLSVVVAKVYPSVHAAVVATKEQLNVSLTAIYNKLNGTDPEVSAALLDVSAQRMAALIDEFGSLPDPALPGYRTLILDGNCIEASEHRLEVVREVAGGPLPGKGLVIYDPQRDLTTKLIPCEDGHAQERSLLAPVYASMSANDLFIADRNFCVSEFFRQAHERSVAVIIREHKNLPWSKITELVAVDNSGKLFEQSIRVHMADGGYVTARRIVVHLDKETRDGDTSIALITNLPAEHASAAIVAELYRDRWTIESHFGMISRAFAAEIPALGYPKAALLAWAVGFIAANVFAVIRAALRAAHPQVDISSTVSEIKLAEDAQRTYEGMSAMSGTEAWSPFQTLETSAMVAWLLRCARNVVLGRYRKTGRGPKKPRSKRTAHASSPHVSTARLLRERKLALNG